MSNLVIETTACHECCAPLDATDNYCRHCGATTANLTGLPANDISTAPFSVRPAVTSLTQQPRLSESPWVVLPLLFLVLGPFALPLLWRSRRFTLVWKSVLTVIMVGVIVFMFWSVWFSVHQALAPLLELGKLKGF